MPRLTKRVTQARKASPIEPSPDRHSQADAGVFVYGIFLLVVCVLAGAGPR